MNSNRSNRQRLLGELVSLDVWHDPLRNKGDTAALHADLLFKEARMGGGADANVRFRMSVRRAALIVRLPEDETIGVDRKTVARGSEPVTGTIRRTLVRERRLAAGGAVAIDSTGWSGSAKVNAEASGSKEDKSTVELERKITMIVATGHRNQGAYQWDLEALDQGPMIGRPWDAVDEPRLMLVDLRKGRSSISSEVKLELHCLREDLVISDIRIQRGNEWKSFFGLDGGAKTAAAEALIIQRLSEELLPVTSIDDDFASIIIASVTAES